MLVCDDFNSGSGTGPVSIRDGFGSANDIDEAKSKRLYAVAWRGFKDYCQLSEHGKVRLRLRWTLRQCSEVITGRFSERRYLVVRAGGLLVFVAGARAVAPLL